MAGVQARVRSLTKKPLQLEAKGKDVVAKLQGEMNAYLNKTTIALINSYPPKPPESRYVRTYKLQRGWHKVASHLTSEGIVGQINNDTEYAIGVQGNEQGKEQWHIHSEHHWPLLKDLLNRAEYNRRIRKALHDALA